MVRWLLWQRLLVVAALVVGVVAMHATPDLCGMSAQQPRTMADMATMNTASTVHLSSTDMAALDPDLAAVPGRGRSHGCGDDHLLALCLAILVAVALLATAAWRRRPPLSPQHDEARRGIGEAFRADRATARTAVRLAQLCVSRR